MNPGQRKKYIFISILLIAVVGFLALNQNVVEESFSAPVQERPNVIIILADDAGYSDFGFMGSKDILTPNLDELAASGMVFTDAHVSASVCSPSRAGLLTGRYQQRFGHECNLDPGQAGAFDGSQVTIAEFLKTKQYHTSIFGKWHLGEMPHQHPLENGFDYFWGFLAGGRSYFPEEKHDQAGDPKVTVENYKVSPFEGYLTDVIGQKAAAYIATRQSEPNPFFMYLAFNAPHTPMHAKQEDIDRFGKDHERPIYAAMMWSMDEAIGVVIDELKSQGLYDNTLIFFLSDNGGAHNNGSRVTPLKGWKGNQYEGGTRVPFVATWKNHIPAGSKFDGLTSSLDIYRTVSTLLDSQDVTNEVLDGADLMPYLAENKLGDPHDELFWRKDEMATIRKKDHKYITLQDTISVMYNLENDLAESTNIEDLNPELADSLRYALNQWQSKLLSPLWVESGAWNNVTQQIYLDLMNNRPPKVKDPSDLFQLTNEVD